MRAGVACMKKGTSDPSSAATSCDPANRAQQRGGVGRAAAQASLVRHAFFEFDPERPVEQPCRAGDEVGVVDGDTRGERPRDRERERGGGLDADRVERFAHADGQDIDLVEAIGACAEHA